MPSARYPKIELGKAMYKRALEGIEHCRSVEAAADCLNLPLADDWTIGFRIEVGIRARITRPAIPG
jgi:hypothetical protein